MTTFSEIPKHVEDVLSRRSLLKSAGLLVVSCSPLATPAKGQTPAGPYPDVNYRQVD